MTNDFPRAIALLLSPAIEGVHSNDPTDKGGDTWYGLSRVAHPDIPWPPTRDQAAQVYFKEYWKPCRCDELPWHAALLLFDAAVQHAPNDAIRFVQSGLGLSADGVLGPRTIAAINGCSPRDFIIRVVAQRVLYYAKLSDWEERKKGWIRRVVTMTLEALAPSPSS